MRPAWDRLRNRAAAPHPGPQYAVREYILNPELGASFGSSSWKFWCLGYRLRRGCPSAWHRMLGLATTTTRAWSAKTWGIEMRKLGEILSGAAMSTELRKRNAVYLSGGLLEGSIPWQCQGASADGMEYKVGDDSLWTKTIAWTTTTTTASSSQSQYSFSSDLHVYNISQHARHHRHHHHPRRVQSRGHAGLAGTARRLRLRVRVHRPRPQPALGQRPGRDGRLLWHRRRRHLWLCKFALSLLGKVREYSFLLESSSWHGSEA